MFCHVLFLFINFQENIEEECVIHLRRGFTSLRKIYLNEVIMYHYQGNNIHREQL